MTHVNLFGTNVAVFDSCEDWNVLPRHLIRTDDARRENWMFQPRWIFSFQSFHFQRPPSYIFTLLCRTALLPARREPNCRLYRRCCYIMVDSATPASQNSACTLRYITPVLHHIKVFIVNNDYNRKVVRYCTV
jgi:hypothetical protein